MPQRATFFLVVIGLFGLGLGFTASILDPLFYTEKVRLIAPPALKNTALSFITIMALLVALIIQPLTGWWSDRTQTRWGKRLPYLVGGVVGLSFSFSLLIIADNLWLLVMAAMLTSACTNTVQGVWQALTPDQVPVTQHGLAAGIKTLLELVGVVAGVVLFGLALARGMIWVTPTAAIAIFWLILIITVYTLWCSKGWVYESRSTQDASQKKAGQLTMLYFYAGGARSTTPSPIQLWIKTLRLARRAAGQLAVLFRRTPTFFWWIVNRILFWSAGIAVRTFILNYLEDVMALPLTEVQALSQRLFLILGMGVFLLVLPAGILADRLGRRPLLIGAGLVAAAGTVMLLFVRDPTLLFVAGGLIAGGAGIFASTSWALATDLAPPGQSALYLGIANGATVLGSIGGRLGGPVIDGLNQTSRTGAMGYLVVFGLAAIFFMASSAAVLRIPGQTVWQKE